MPIYGYECRACKRDFETLVRGGDPVACPFCDSADLDRLLSRVARPPSSDGSQEMPCGREAGEVGGGCGRCGAMSGGCD